VNLFINFHLLLNVLFFTHIHIFGDDETLDVLNVGFAERNVEEEVVRAFVFGFEKKYYIDLMMG
jgi:hypothetical protein